MTQSQEIDLAYDQYYSSNDEVEVFPNEIKYKPRKP